MRCFERSIKQLNFSYGRVKISNCFLEVNEKAKLFFYIFFYIKNIPFFFRRKIEMKMKFIKKIFFVEILLLTHCTADSGGNEFEFKVQHTRRIWKDFSKFPISQISIKHMKKIRSGKPYSKIRRCLELGNLRWRKGSFFQNLLLFTPEILYENQIRLQTW